VFRRFISIICIFVVISSNVVIAGDSNLSLITSTRALSLGGHYYAGSDNITSTFTNPAKVLCTLGFGFDMNVNDRAGQQMNYKSNGDLYRSYLLDDFSGSAGMYWVPSTKIGFGLVYNRALDYSVRWPLAMLFNVNNVKRVYGFQLTSRLRADAISPVIGFRLRQLALGFSANIYSFNSHLSFPVSNPEYELNGEDPAYQLDIVQTGQAFSWNTGFVYMVSNQLRVGGSLRGGVSVDLSGNANTDLFFDIDSTAQKSQVNSRIKTPTIGGLGILYKINDNLSLNLDVTASLWGSTLSSSEFAYDDTAWVSRIPITVQDSVTGYSLSKQPLEFRNSFDIGLGIEYRTEGNLQYRFGYRFTQTPNSKQSFSLLMPEVNRHWFSLGIGYQQAGYIIDLGIAYSLGIGKEIPDSVSEHFSGEYDSKVIIPSINVRYVFK